MSNKTYRNIPEENKRVRQNIRDYYKEKEQEEQALNEEVDMYAHMEKGKVYNKASMSVRNKLNDDVVLKNKMKVNEYNNSKVFPKLFGSAVFEAIELSDEDKIANAKLIFEKAETIFNEGVKANVLDVEGSPIFNNVFSYAKEQTRTVKEKMDPKQVIKTAKEVYKANSLELGYLKERVANKVAKAISDERELTKIKESLQESDLYFEENKTLFRYLHEVNIDRITQEEDFIAETEGDEGKINAFAFAEAIVDYTILEVLNTSKMLKTDPKTLHKKISLVTNQKI